MNKFFGSRLPVVKDDDWVYCVEDFLTKVVHDLNWIEFPNSGRRRFTTTWEKVDSVLMQDEDFGKFYKMNNPLAKEQAALNLPDTLPVKERTARLRELLKNNFAWNGNFGIYAVGERKLQKERTANSATLNFALRSMLRDANIQAHPVNLFTPACTVAEPFDVANVNDVMSTSWSSRMMPLPQVVPWVCCPTICSWSEPA